MTSRRISQHLTHSSRAILLISYLFVFFSASHAQTPAVLSGLVVDENGAAVAGAAVRLVRSTGPEQKTSTDGGGRFEFNDLDSVNGTLIIEAAGFQDYRAALTANENELRVVLSPAAVNGTVTVTGSETRLQETAASVIAIGRRDLDISGAATLDDRLRQVPGFSLFRRAGSRTANPTTQGVSLRGVGASGASRALVLADGVPLNDPFGSWVYWGRIPSEAISQVEILRGPSGDLYGSSAIGGVIAVATHKPDDDPVASFETSYGTQNTPMVSAFASAAVSKWRGSLAGEVFHTDGFIPVEPAARGAVDTNANVERSVLIPHIERAFKNDSRIFGKAEFFQEMRENGTRLQTNDTHLRNFSTGLDWEFSRRSSLSLRGNAGTQNYNQTFSAVSADRNNETLNRLQHVPVDFFGVSGQWNGSFGQNVVFAGFDARGVRGHSDETGLAGGVPTSVSDAGGRELTSGIFAGIIIPISRLTLSGGFRVDWWRNYDGFTRTRSLVSGATTNIQFPDRSESAVSPRVSALYRLTDRVSLAATFASGFRRPTLNELYRNFRVGDVLTLANANLKPERAFSFDAAAIVNALNQRLYFRPGVFCTTISDNVSNVTQTVTSTLITRQRQNVGRTRACGIEADVNLLLTRDLKLSGSYQFVDSHITSFPANTALEGLQIPQIPRHHASIQLAYFGSKIATFGMQIRAVGPQFDDDQNQFRLAGFITLDAFVSRRLTRQVEVFAAAENLFDSKIEAGRTPVLTLGSPRTFRFGFRFRFGRN